MYLAAELIYIYIVRRSIHYFLLCFKNSILYSILYEVNELMIRSSLSHHACCYIYFIQTNSCTLFKTHSHL